MNFSIQQETENGLGLCRISNLQNGSSVAFLPAHGAAWHEWLVPVNGQLTNLIDNYQSLDHLQQEFSLSYKSAKLSPFVCRIPEGKYSWGGKEYEISRKFIDGSAIHGLLFNKPFKITDEFVEDQSAGVRLKYQFQREETGYPFHFNCEIVYELFNDNTLSVETTLLNLDDSPIPIADGWHPYFTLGGTINQYELGIASDTLLEFNEKLIPTGQFIHEPAFQQPSLLGDRFLDNCFLLQAAPDSPVCSLHNPENGLTLWFFANDTYPYLQLYTPDHRKSIAIENLSGAPDCFNNGMGLTILDPRRSATFKVAYRVNFP
jgi:aldose 1-epimerase